MIYQELLKEFRGKTATKNILHDATKIILENKMNELKFNPRPNCVSMVHSLVKNSNEIAHLGGSTPPDLLNDNFLKLLAGMTHARGATYDANITMIDTGGVTETFRSYDKWNIGNGSPTDDQLMFATSGGGGICQIQIGAGLATALRTDIDIETAFSNGGSEDSKQTINVPIYDTLLNELPMGIGMNSTGAGSISETCLFEQYQNSLRVNQVVMLARDNISPVVPFTFGQAIFVQYVLAL